MGSPSECFATVLVASASRLGRPPVESGWSSRSSVASPLPLRWQRGKPMANWCVGRWPFPLAPPAFVPHHAAYGVPSQLDMSLVRFAPGRDLHDLCLSFGDATGTVRPLDSFATDSLPARPHGPSAGCAATPDSTGLLSWGFPKSAPPPTSPSRVHSRADLFLRETCPLARTCQGPNLFRPCRSSRLRRFAPRDGLQACRILQPVMGFATFQGRNGILPAAGIGSNSAVSPPHHPAPITIPRDRATAKDSPVHAIWQPGQGRAE